MKRGKAPAKEAAAAKAEAAAARDDEKTEKAQQQAQQLAQPNAQATQELSSSGQNLRELVEPCAKQCCTNKKNFCLAGELDHECDQKEACCQNKHENCLMHAANGGDCALSPLCSKQEKEEAKDTYAHHWDQTHGDGTKRSYEEMKAASAAANKEARMIGQPSDVDVVSLRDMITPCAKQCCTNKKDFCLSGADHDGASCAKSSDPAECCEGRLDSCFYHAANGRNCAFSPLCSDKEKKEAAGPQDSK